MVRTAIKIKERLPEHVDDQSMYECSLYAVEKSIGLKAKYPTQITSKKALIACTIPHKKDFPLIWEFKE